jgi:hypothetical protein
MSYVLGAGCVCGFGKMLEKCPINKKDGKQISLLSVFGCYLSD